MARYVQCHLLSLLCLHRLGQSRPRPDSAEASRIIDPGSGTAWPTGIAVAENVTCAPPCGPCVVSSHLPSVASKPDSVSVPVPETVRLGIPCWLPGTNC